MLWEKLIELYPFIITLAKKLPGLKKSLEKSGQDNPMLELQLETIQKILELRRTIEFTGYMTAKLSNPEANKEDFFRAQKWSEEMYSAIHPEK